MPLSQGPPGVLWDGVWEKHPICVHSLDHVFKFRESDLQLVEKESENWVPPEALQWEQSVGLKWSWSGLIPEWAHTTDVLKCEAAFHGSSSLFSLPCP